jgi:hypothetical protein
MPYLGNEAAEKFVSKPAVDHFSGDGSTTAFTLSFPVASDQDILVSVDGVIQDTAAYAVSNSTTLTFTAAPSSNSGNNIFVNYLARVSATVAHPATSALTATTGTFTDDVTVATNKLFVDASTDLIGMGTTSPATATGGGIDIHRGGGSSVRIDDTTNSVTGEMQVYSAGLNLATVTDHPLILSTNNTTAMNITGDGEITKPLQPSFHAYPDGNISVSNSTSLTTFAANTEIYDVGSNFNVSTYKFTAPVTGQYLIKWAFRLDSSDSGATYYYYRIYTSNRTYDQIFKPTADETYSAPHNIAIVDLDANDEAYLQYQQYSGTNNHATIVSNSALTYIQGMLLG